MLLRIAALNFVYRLLLLVDDVSTVYTRLLTYQITDETFSTCWRFVRVI